MKPISRTLISRTRRVAGAVALLCLSGAPAWADPPGNNPGWQHHHPEGRGPHMMHPVAGGAGPDRMGPPPGGPRPPGAPAGPPGVRPPGGPPAGGRPPGWHDGHPLPPPGWHDGRPAPPPGWHGGPPPNWHTGWASPPPPPRLYPHVGATVNFLPPNPYYVRYGGAGFYYSSGIWYRPWGPSFVVTAPPIGVYVPVLPGYYVVRRVGAVDYYVANDVYYMGSGNGYRVVSPPSEDGDWVEDVAQNDRPQYAYPRQNQSEEQQSRDKWECHSWAQEQSGFDPTRPLGGVPADESARRRDDYQRANAACMDARGYEMR
ncbi:DUF6515 family protein [Niveibacterium sp. SC-1]|uniref:DUF6515 family protein n=1 Tax=Niveibacterium sp. SC-1 TaxID=3135646 RepID=UPI0031200831